jgi:hypothetical protein
VRRGNVGALVPEPGHGVQGYADGPDGSETISIIVGGNRIVTIITGRNGLTSTPEYCVLPSAPQPSTSN